jgi:hypothetical protein
MFMTFTIANTLFPRQTPGIEKSADFVLGHAKTRPSTQHEHDFRYLPFGNDHSAQFPIKNDHTLLF